MSIRILEQPDGRYAAWSSVVDDFLVEDKSEEEIKEWYVERKKREAEEEIEERLEKADSGSFVNRGPTSYEEAVDLAER